MKIIREVSEDFSGYDLIIQNNNQTLKMQRNSAFDITWMLYTEVNANNENFFIIKKDDELFPLIDELYNSIINCDINLFKEFSYNEFIKFMKVYKNICDIKNNKLTFTINDDTMEIVKHDKFYKIKFNNNKIKFSKESLSFIFLYFDKINEGEFAEQSIKKKVRVI